MPGRLEPDHNMIDLWPFQADVVERTRLALRRHTNIEKGKFGRVGLVLPTGAGKTACASSIALRTYEQLGKDRKPGSVLFLVHRKELLRQTERTFCDLGLEDEIGVIASGRPGRPWRPIQIGSIPTVTRRIGRLTWLCPRLIIVDEGHHATARTWKKIVDHWPRSFAVFLTATPMRNDDTGLGDMMDELVLGPQIGELTPDYLAPVETFAVEPDFPASAKSLKAQAAYQTSAVIAKAVENWQRLAPNDKTIFFAVDIDHSKRVVGQLRERGVVAEHVDYMTPDRTRDEIFHRMLGGEIQCISNVGLFTEGLDWPDCQCVVICRRTGSLIVFKQMVGRMMRRKGDGSKGKAIDLCGNVYLHGQPDADVHWDLEKGVANRKEIRKKAGANRTCEVCSYVYPKREPCCPLCGAAPLRPAVLEVDAEIRKIEGGNGGGTRGPTKRQLTAEIAATGGDVSKLRKIRVKYGYQPGWERKMAKVYSFMWNRGSRGVSHGF